MKTPDNISTQRQRAGGYAAIYLAVAYLLAMPFFLLLVDLEGASGAGGKVELLAAHHWSTHAMYLIAYVVFGIALGVVALALYRRLRDTAPLLMQVATVVGLFWAFALVASGMVFNAGMAAAVGLYPTDPAAAASVWQTVEPIADGLGGSGGEILGGVWVLLVSVAVLRANGFSRALGWFGVVLGAVGLLSAVPPANQAAYAFGLLQIAWFVWVGISLLRPRREPAPALVLTAESA